MKEYGLNPLFVRNRITDFLQWSRGEEGLLESKTKELLKNKPKPFVKWVGGKRQLIKQFKDMGLFPPSGFNPKKSTYIEPFVGGGAMFFDALPLNNAVLSDMNEELVITYNVIKTDVESLIKELKAHQKKNNKNYFLGVRAINIDKLSDVKIASRFIYLNRTCFNGMYRVNSSGGFNVPFGLNTNPLICDDINLKKVSISLQDVEIKHSDYSNVVSNAKKGDFIYFDPPYAPISKTSSFTSYTKAGFGKQQQIELRDTFFKLHKRGCFIMLSNSNSDFIKEIYGEITMKSKKIKLHEVFANRAINSKGDGRGKVKEIVVVNY